jgi:hypothetical protein
MNNHFPSRNRSIEALVNSYVSTHRRSRWPISTREAVRAIKTIAPVGQDSERIISDLVARRAIQCGCNVAFDAFEPEFELLRPVGKALSVG